MMLIFADPDVNQFLVSENDGDSLCLCSQTMSIAKYCIDLEN